MSEIDQQLRQVDFDFVDLRNEGMSSFHWYPATFLAALPGSVIPLLSGVGDVVLDPFCGTSTTGLEALRLGRAYIGIDRNPVAALIGRGRLALPRMSDLRRALESIAGEYFPSRSRTVDHVNERELRDWYHEETLLELNYLLRCIDDVGNFAVRSAGLAMFSSILKTCSSQNRHWGWVCDNVKPKPGEIVYKNALQAFQKSYVDYLTSYRHLVEDMKFRKSWDNLSDLRAKVNVICEDSIDALAGLPPESIDLIFTSPPYYGVADYTKSQRLTFLWLSAYLKGISGGFSLEEIRLRETGARSKRHRKESFSEYAHYMQGFFASCSKVLKVGRFLCLVIGESGSRRGTIETLRKSAVASGFSERYSTSREIKLTQRRLMAKVSNEQIIVFQLQ